MRDYARSLSMEGRAQNTGDNTAVRENSLIRTNNSNSSSLRKDSISFPRDTGDRLLNLISLSHEIADEILGNVDSSIVARVGDSGDRLVVKDDEVEDNGSPNFIVGGENKSFEMGVGPVTDDSLVLNHVAKSNDMNYASPISPLTVEIVSSLPNGSTLASVDKNQAVLIKTSSIKGKQYRIFQRLDCCNYMIHLALFGFFGVLTRYSLGKLFGPSDLALTSDDSLLYLDLPANILGCFLIGWFGIVFKTDIRQISDHLVVGLTTGYLGSLTTFSGWNQKMLDLSANGHWLFAFAGVILGMFIVNESITIGVESAEALRKWLLQQFNKSLTNFKSKLEQWRVEMRIQNIAVIILLFLAMLAIWFLFGALAILKLHSLADETVLWWGCTVGPPGVWVRWYLARLNGQGLGEKRYFKWLPIGTLCANVLAASLMAVLAILNKLVNKRRYSILISGVQLGFLGCLSTVSTFVAEVYTMRQSGNKARAFFYTALTFLLSFALGTLIYSVPVWAKHYN
ncbi:fluoride export protein 1-like [Ananas comosus]|nr:fluoride export protein 1-like [Ananas comosus]